MDTPAAPARRTGTVRLDLTHHGDLPAHVDEALRNNLSALELTGDSLWTASDETAQIERLTTTDGGRSYTAHTAFALADMVELPGGPAGEVDIEGLAADSGYLWVTGSMSLARKKPKPRQADNAQALARLTEVKREPNRWLLGRIPCLPSAGGGGHVLRKEVLLADGTRRRAAFLPFAGKHGNLLTRALRTDDHLSRFLDVPAKENGFDVEGIAACQDGHGRDRVFLGLRGPVLRGWAAVLELRLTEPDERPGCLLPQPPGHGDELYAKHFLDLGGLGIRDLKRQGDDLLILAGPTMDLDGPVQLWRWPGALRSGTATVVPRDALDLVLDLPHGRGCDHAEGICLTAGGGRLLVAYDNPAPQRLHADGAAVDLDLFDLG